MPTISWEEGLKVYDTNKDGRIADDRGHRRSAARSTRCSGPRYGFPAFDGDRDGKLDAKEWDVFRAMLASENGLLAITLGGKGDMTASAVKWKYTRPVPQVPSTLLYQGVLFMVNDSGILLVVRSGDRHRAEAGPAEGRDRQVLRLAGRRRRQGLPGQPGRHRVGRRRARASGRSWRSIRSTTRSSPRRPSPTARSTCARSRRCMRSRPRPLTGRADRFTYDGRQ